MKIKLLSLLGGNKALKSNFLVHFAQRLFVTRNLPHCKLSASYKLVYATILGCKTKSRGVLNRFEKSSCLAIQV